MSKVSIADLLQAVEGLHNCKAKYKETTHVKESFEGNIVWEGDVYIFDLKGHEKTKRAYAWSSPIEESDKRRFYAILEIDPVQYALDAVRASVISSYEEADGQDG